jgi:hypothetical protein
MPNPNTPFVDDQTQASLDIGVSEKHPLQWVPIRDTVAVNDVIDLHKLRIIAKRDPSLVSSKGTASNVTTVITYVQAPVLSSGIEFAEGAIPAGVSGNDLMWGDAGLHRIRMNNNSGASDQVVGASTTDTFLNKTFDTAATGNNLKINGTAITAVTGSGSVVLATTPSISAPTITGHPTVEGVTSTGATGSGKFVFDNAPTITGHPTIEGVTSTGAQGTGKFVFDTSPTITTPTISGAIPSYNGLTTAGQGLPPILVYAASTPTTPVGATNILASAPAGLYEVKFYSVVTTTGTVGTNFKLNIIYTDAQQAQTIVAFTNTTFTAGDVNQGSFLIQNQSTNNIQYSITETGSFTVHPVLALKIALERIN